MEPAKPELPAGDNPLPSLTPARPVSRNGVVQGVLDLYEDPAYLEIGVNKGMTFKAVSAAKKVGVDPKFVFDFKAYAQQFTNCSFHETTSDDYFGRIAGLDSKFHVIYLDGLHTAEQTVRDLLNAIFFLRQDGVIVIDDVFPCSYAASLPNRQETRTVRKATGDTLGAWMGDVYRLVFFVETFCQQFSYCTVNNNHGQLILWRGPRPTVPDRTLEDVGMKQYKDLFSESASFQCAPLAEVLNRISAARVSFGAAKP